MEIGEQLPLNRQSYVLRGVSAVAVVTVAVGCSSDEAKREFAVPKSLCGVSVPTDALSRLLPASGKNLDVQQDGDIDQGNDLCNLTVDGTMVLVISRERIDTGDSAQHILVSRARVSHQKTAVNGAIAYADRAAASMIKCRGAGIEVEDISTFIKVLKPARPNETAMKKLITDYTTAYKKQQPCRPGS
ncbi:MULTISPECIES: hypothetical protein [unclassified Streptomyces]|uniref:hypothetical protein n=1 Tax=unclassified Streptomyces TaxID=2593676 RepID=UPI002741CDAE|nr:MULTISPECIES: hypothetical protein [unclassified Streptomyces]